MFVIKSKPHIFVSYRRNDSAYVASTITEKLVEYFGKECVFFDVDTVPLGVDFREQIELSIRKCDVVLVIIGDSWISVLEKDGSRRLDNPKDTVRIEVEIALQRDIPVIPVLVGNAIMPSKEDLPQTMQELFFRNAAEVRAGSNLQTNLDRLLMGIEKTIGITPSVINANSYRSKFRSSARILLLTGLASIITFIVLGFTVYTLLAYEMQITFFRNDQVAFSSLLIGTLIVSLIVLKYLANKVE